MLCALRCRDVIDVQPALIRNPAYEALAAQQFEDAQTLTSRLLLPCIGVFLHSGLAIRPELVVVHVFPYTDAFCICPLGAILRAVLAVCVTRFGDQNVCVTHKTFADEGHRASSVLMPLRAFCIAILLVGTPTYRRATMTAEQVNCQGSHLYNSLTLDSCDRMIRYFDRRTWPYADATPGCPRRAWVRSGCAQPAAISSASVPHWPPVAPFWVHGCDYQPAGR